MILPQDIRYKNVRIIKKLNLIEHIRFTKNRIWKYALFKQHILSMFKKIIRYTIWALFHVFLQCVLRVPFFDDFPRQNIRVPGGYSVIRMPRWRGRKWEVSFHSTVVYGFRGTARIQVVPPNVLQNEYFYCCIEACALRSVTAENSIDFK
jgi:hypothetical protein